MLVRIRADDDVRLRFILDEHVWAEMGRVFPVSFYGVFCKIKKGVELCGEGRWTSWRMVLRVLTFAFTPWHTNQHSILMFVWLSPPMYQC
jgi:hypothetical protein